MKKLYAIIVAIIMLTACADSAPDLQSEASAAEQQISSSTNSASESPVSSISSSASSQSEIIIPESFYYPFIIPAIDCSFADEVTMFVSEFGHEFLFPEFESVKTLDLTSGSISSNLYWLTEWRNDELILQGSGTTPTQKEKLLKEKENIYLSVVRCDDMTLIGRRYFGNEFVFPKNFDFKELSPLETDTDYYVWTAGREGFIKYYLLINIEENQNYINATFLPFDFHRYLDLDLEINFIAGINFLNFNYAENGIRYYASLDNPIVYDSEQLDMATCLEKCLLPVPQEDLGTITVTFQREDTGNLIATSCKYNRK